MAFSSTRGTHERWLSTWAYILNSLSRGITAIDSERNEVSQLLRSPDKRARVGLAVKGVSWADLYEWPIQVQFAWSAVRIIPLGELYELFSPANFRKRFAELHDGQMKGSSYEPSTREMPKIIAHMQAMSAQLRALVYCGRSMSDLIRGAREDNDEDFFLAVRIDPAVITGRFGARRIQRALAIGEPRFMTKLTTKLRTPIKAEGELDRLQAALWLLSLTKQLQHLTEESAAELFIRRTRLYRQHGAQDAQRSLWRYIQRWKNRHTTKSGKKMSSQF